MNQQAAEPGLFIGMDWADQKHDIYLIDRDGKGAHQLLEHSAKNIDAWVNEMLKLAGGRPIAIMLEQSRGALIYALMFRENVLLYPINPKQLARYRQSYPGGGKDDPTDAMYLARMLCERITTLKAWEPDDEHTRLIGNLSQQRRKIVDGQTKLRQQLNALLKSYFPVVLELFGKQHQLPSLLSVLRRWPDPRTLRRADRRLICQVLRDHGIRNEQQQKEIIQRIRSAELLTRDNALITPAAMAGKLLADQIQQAQKTIEELDTAIAEAMKRHHYVHLFTNLRGAGSALAPRLLCAFGSQLDPNTLSCLENSDTVRLRSIHRESQNTLSSNRSIPRTTKIVFNPLAENSDVCEFRSLLPAGGCIDRCEFGNCRTRVGLFHLCR